jgi:hypothetical protein
MAESRDFFIHRRITLVVGLGAESLRANHFKRAADHEQSLEFSKLMQQGRMITQRGATSTEMNQNRTSAGVLQRKVCRGWQPVLESL